MSRPPRDGHGRSRPAASEHPTAGPSRLVPDLGWEVSYDLSTVRTYLSDIEAEGHSLRRQLQQARARIQRAHEVAAERAAAASELGSRILAMQGEMEALEREHRASLDAIEATASHETAKLIDRAQAQVATFRSAARLVSQDRRDG